VKRVIASLTLAALSYSVMQMMVQPALPEMQRALGADPSATAWVISAFLLSTTVATPILGRLGDLFGKERVLIVSLVVFALGGVVGALAQSLGMLILARVLQGVGGAVFPLSFGLARDALPERQVPIAIAIIAGSFGVGGSLGLVLCGPLVDAFSWHAIFVVGLVLPVVAVVCVRVWVPESPERARVSLDWAGALGLTLGLVALLTAVSRGRDWGWTSAPVLGLLAVALLVLGAWCRWELGRRDPLIDLRLFARRSIWPVNVVAVLVGFGMYSTGFLIPQFVQTDPDAAGFGFAASVTGASMFMLPALLCGLLAGAWAGLLARRFGAKLPLLLGTLLMVAGYAGLVVAHDGALPFSIFTAIAHGFGLNLAYTAMSTLIVAAAPAEQVGEASGMNTMLRTVGGALGSQIVGALIAGGVTATGFATEDVFTASFVVLMVLLVIGSAIAVLLVPSDRARPARIPAAPRPIPDS
jgi:EmrB/QacA subfamily drug resistance transporter